MVISSSLVAHDLQSLLSIPMDDSTASSSSPRSAAARAANHNFSPIRSSSAPRNEEKSEELLNLDLAQLARVFEVPRVEAHAENDDDENDDDHDENDVDGEDLGNASAKSKPWRIKGEDGVDFSVKETAEKVAPLLQLVQTSEEKLREVRTAAEALRNKVARDCLQFDGGEEGRISQEAKRRIRSHLEASSHGLNEEKEYVVVRREDVEGGMVVNDVERITGGLVETEEFQRFAEGLRDVTAVEAYLDVLKAAPNRFVKKLPAVDMRDVDCRHQDERDIERDRLCVNSGIVYLGHELKYEGVVDVLRSHIEKLVLTFQPVQEEAVSTALKRFARTILNVGNRTNSGGEAYDVILSILRADEAVLITPDSTRLEPLTVQLSIGPVMVDQGWDWAVIADLSATTFYLLTDKDDVEISHGSVTGRFKHRLAMPLPVPRFKTHLAVDDGLESNRKDYAVNTSLGGEVVVDVELKLDSSLA